MAYYVCYAQNVQSNETKMCPSSTSQMMVDKQIIFFVHSLTILSPINLQSVLLRACVAYDYQTKVVI